MTEARKGVLAMVAACSIWGLSALYYRLLNHVPPLEVLSHRTLWSLVFFGLVLLVQGRLREVGALLGGGRQLAYVALASLMISANWFLFILSIQIGRAVESSLGYYIFPLVAVLMGAGIFGERLSRAQWGAVALAALAVLGLTLGLGVAPWISLALAVTFALYGVIKKSLRAGPVVSVTAEVILLAPLALVWLWGVHVLGWEGLTGRNVAAFGQSWRESLLLACAGPITAGPLILFSYASRRIPLSTLGLVQYLNPTLQFLVAVLVLGEPFTRWHALAFPMIWAALALYSLDALRQDRALRRAETSAGTSSNMR
ncbi:EamA-like transporter family protein [Pseudoruegeria aquimaris]|uniref:EamA-like transporter family protein n=1 Tax=Pseudoruegeria aquimaris TaxID=393663 RepID=A0A1Y5RPV4_9RHOB|nr:EamA family transporter RarD [Pseudoruegeria aquimaris]SLN22582.1 EamA-like transporter family protein [Pseudoruegeria aquimaris]